MSDLPRPIRQAIVTYVPASGCARLSRGEICWVKFTSLTLSFTAFCRILGVA